MIAGGIFAVAFIASVIFGAASMKSCLAAFILSGFAGFATLLPVFLTSRLSIMWIMAASVIRLLLMVSGSAIILIFANVNIMWFVAWIGLFYIILLASEISFALGMAKKN